MSRCQRRQIGASGVNVSDINMFLRPDGSWKQFSEFFTEAAIAILGKQLAAILGYTKDKQHEDY